MYKKIFMAIIALMMSFSGANAAYLSGGNHDSNRRDRHDDHDCDKRGKDDRDRRGKDLKILGLTSDQKLVRFDEDCPYDTKYIGHISGLSNDTLIIGIDFRVQDGKLYGVGNAGGIYTIDTNDASALYVNTLTVPLNGAAFGVDFNPAADRLRIISDTGQNLRHNVNAGGVTILDGMLNYIPGTPAVGVTGAAYTNNDLDANTATTLLDIDSNLDQVALQVPPNNGSLAATGKLTIDVTSVVGFDIYSTVRDGVTVDLDAFAALVSAADGKVRLYGINLLTGKATKLGRFNSDDQIIDIALPLNQR
jgi:Domain of unknown function (DUF4394)